jgi:hypothetical protein
MRFLVGSDNRSGSVSVKVGKPDARDDSYNVDPGRGLYGKITRKMSESAGAGTGQMTAALETSSEFVGYQKATLDCAGLSFKSKGTIKLPQDAAAQGRGVVHDSISMGFRVAQGCKVQLTASVLSDLDIAEIRLTGPSFAKPLRIFDEHDETHDLKPGEYMLKGAYQLAVTLPDSSLGGRPLTVELQATLTPVS